MEKLIEQYNDIKKRAGYPTDQYVTEYGAHSELRYCTQDENIEKIINMFYLYELDFQEICDRHSESFVEQYRKVISLQNEFIQNVSNITSDRYFNYARALHKANNYRILNSYFNGIIIGLRITEELKSE